jgi:hypothetical protein
MLVRYLLASCAELPPISAPLYEYVFAGNGVFKRAVRKEMRAILPVSECAIRGLAPVEPELSFQFDRVPESIIQQILDTARDAARNWRFFFTSAWRMKSGDSKFRRRFSGTLPLSRWRKAQARLTSGPSSKFIRIIGCLLSFHRMMIGKKPAFASTA